MVISCTLKKQKKMKTTYNNLLYTCLGCYLLVIFFGCNKEVVIEHRDSYKKLYIPQAVKGMANISFESTASAPDTIVYGAAMGGFDLSAVNVLVKFEVMQSAVDSYNQANGTSYTLLPPGSYKAGLETVIPKGRTNSDLSSVIVSPEALEVDKAYLLPITLTDGNNTVINAGLQTYFIKVKVQPEKIIYTNLDRKGWEVVGFSDEEPEAGYQGAAYVLDGNPYTWWNTKFKNGTAPFPHHIIIDMKKAQDLYGVYFQNRDFGGWDGYRATGVTIYVSNDNITWVEHETFTEIPLPEGERLTAQAPLIFSQKVNTRYIKFEALSNNGGESIICISEIGGIGKE
jgi:hypothetical protein